MIKLILEILVGIGFILMVSIWYIPAFIIHPDWGEDKAFLFGVLLLILFICVYFVAF